MKIAEIARVAPQSIPEISHHSEMAPLREIKLKQTTLPKMHDNPVGQTDGGGGMGEKASKRGKRDNSVVCVCVCVSVCVCMLSLIHISEPTRLA